MTLYKWAEPEHLCDLPWRGAYRIGELYQCDVCRRWWESDWLTSSRMTTGWRKRRLRPSRRRLAKMREAEQ